MHHFRPTRASPTSKSTLLPDHTLDSAYTDISRSSAVSVHELAGLTEQEVELLDAVIERASPSATTFLTVFKAYNDVLNERGIDPHEVLYYGKLLKLGTLKGRNWGDKWSMVKKQYNYQGSSSIRPQGQSRARVSNRLSKPVPGRVKSPLAHHTEVSFTSNSRVDESGLETDQDSATVSLVESCQPVHLDETEESPFAHDIGRHSPVAKTRRVRHLLDGLPRGRWQGDVSDTTEDYIPSTTPPSYRAALRDPRPDKAESPTRSLAILSQPPAGDAARKAIALARERRGSIVNEQAAWNKIRLERDERDAENFRSDRLLERCWEVWKQGFQWIIVRFHPTFASIQS
jgi:protein SFI1